MKLNRVVDMNDLQDACTAYSEAFEVIIHIRRMELQGERVQYYYHSNNNLAERHITIMLNNHNDEYDHCYSMLHIRNWCIPNTTAARAGLLGYCDYCNRIKTTNNETKCRSLIHLNECRPNFYNQTLSNNAMKKTDYKRVPFQYDIKKNNIFVNYVFNM